MPKLGKPGKNSYMKVNIDNSCKYFSFVAYQRTVQLLYETLDTSIEDLTAFTVIQSYHCRQTDWQIQGQHNCLFKKNNLVATAAQIIFLE